MKLNKNDEYIASKETWIWLDKERKLFGFSFNTPFSLSYPAFSFHPKAIIYLSRKSFLPRFKEKKKLIQLLDLIKEGGEIK